MYMPKVVPIIQGGRLQRLTEFSNNIFILRLKFLANSLVCIKIKKRSRYEVLFGEVTGFSLESNYDCLFGKNNKFIKFWQIIHNWKHNVNELHRQNASDV